MMLLTRAVKLQGPDSKYLVIKNSSSEKKLAKLNLPITWGTINFPNFKNNVT